MAERMLERGCMSGKKMQAVIVSLLTFGLSENHTERT